MAAGSTGYGERPGRTRRTSDIVIYVGALIAVPVFVFLFSNLMNSRARRAEGRASSATSLSLSLMGKLLFGTFIIGVPAILIWSYAKGTRTEAQMMTAAMVLIIFNVFFWTLFEQAGSSLTLFADRNTDRSVFGLFTISAPQTQNFNPICIVLFAPLMSMLWTGARQARPRAVDPGQVRDRADGRRRRLPVPGVRLDLRRAGNNFQVGLWWLAGLYLIHSLAELCISPVGLSMITKLSIARDRRPDDGRLVPVDLGRAIFRGHRRPVRQRRDGRRAGHQPQGQPRHLYRRRSRPSPGSRSARASLLFLLSWPLQKWMHGVK